jgi:hypothetical protein
LADFRQSRGLVAQQTTTKTNIASRSSRHIQGPYRRAAPVASTEGASAIVQSGYNTIT